MNEISELKEICGYASYVPKNAAHFRIQTKKGNYFADFITPWVGYYHIFNIELSKAKKISIENIKKIESI